MTFIEMYNLNMHFSFALKRFMSVNTEDKIAL